MRCYYYRLLLPTGQTKRGLVKLAVESSHSARIYLEGRWKAVVVLSIFAFPAWFNVLYDSYRMLFKRSIGSAHLADFFHNLAVMLESGVPIIEALQELAEKDNDPHIIVLAEDMLEGLSSGNTFADSLERRSDVIPSTVRCLAGIGEKSGTLDRTLRDAADHLGRINTFARNTKRAMIYPLFVFFSILVAFFFWVYSVVPNLGALFGQMGVELPALARWVIGTASGVHNNIVMVLIVFLLVFAVCYFTYRYHSKTRYVVDLLLYHMPVTKTLVRSSNLAFISEYLSLLHSAGINIIQSLEVLSDSTHNEVYKRKINSVILGVRKGNSLSSEMRNVQLFPGFGIRMISIGERTGTLDKQLTNLALEFHKRFEHLVGIIGEIIQPLTILIAGAFFLFMIIALFLPIYQLIGQIIRH